MEAATCGPKKHAATVSKMLVPKKKPNHPTNLLFRQCFCK